MGPGTVLSHLTWRKTVVIALAIPLSVAKNGLRTFVLAMLATHVDRTFLTGRLHHQGGIIYFLIALAAIFLLIWVARRREEKPRTSAINRSLITVKSQPLDTQTVDRLWVSPLRAPTRCGCPAIVSERGIQLGSDGCQDLKSVNTLLY